MTEDDSEDFGIDERANSGDKVLHDICRVLDSRNWILSEGMIINNENLFMQFEKQMASVVRIFDHSKPVFKKSNSSDED